MSTLRNSSSTAQSTLYLTHMNYTRNTNNLQHSIIVCGPCKLIITLRTPRIGPTGPAVNNNSQTRRTDVKDELIVRAFSIKQDPFRYYNTPTMINDLEHHLHALVKHPIKNSTPLNSLLLHVDANCITAFVSTHTEIVKDPLQWNFGTRISFNTFLLKPFQLEQHCKMMRF